MDENNVETVVVETEPVVENEVKQPVVTEPQPVVKECNCQPQKETKTLNPFAIIGFVLSLCSGLLLPSLIFSIIGLAKWRDYKESNKGFAIAGIIICGVAVLSVFISAVAFSALILGFLPRIPELLEQINA